ncbi:MAG: threonine synthase [Candidatus Bipolaricaulota bacterium]|nr:threonine synthase [Candidatus Bipolaricaulota bacterium]MDW8126534.1 threonine synthase [Candidatus Bipolaricaulota bacterium]
MHLNFCPRCGVPLRWQGKPVHVGPEDLRGRGVWRYQPFLPDVEPVSLGEGGTPLLPAPSKSVGARIFWKLEFLNPTGSFKDRGASVMVSALRAFGAMHVADDSSGNAGAALAAYAAQAGLRAHLFVPAYASGPKVRQIAAYGAELHRVPGPRAAATAAVQRACADNPHLIYASHNSSPYFISGIMTLAFEIAEELGWRSPDHVVVPVGGGGLLLGLFYGFALLAELGWVEKLPKIHAAQAAACAPIVRALAEGLSEPKEVEPGETIAEGARIPKPERGKEIIMALRVVEGSGVMVEEEEIQRAQSELAKQGLYVEPTAALAPAALPKLVAHGTIKPNEVVVIPLTGFGLKTS